MTRRDQRQRLVQEKSLEGDGSNVKKKNEIAQGCIFRRGKRTNKLKYEIILA